MCSDLFYSTWKEKILQHLETPLKKFKKESLEREMGENFFVATNSQQRVKIRSCRSHAKTMESERKPLPPKQKTSQSNAEIYLQKSSHLHAAFPISLATKFSGNSTDVLQSDTCTRHQHLWIVRSDEKGTDPSVDLEI